MALDMWLAFVAASMVVLLIPGPTVLLVVSYALSHGRRAALATTAGVALGDSLAMTASLAGLGVLMMTSATLFTVFKWVGAAYLVYLGVKMWLTPVADQAIDADLTDLPAGKMFWHTFTVTALNPKSIVFFVAFVPQFIDPTSPYWEQAALAIATFVTLAAINVTAYALLASHARGLIKRVGVRRAVNRTSGSLLIGAGVITALWRRAVG